MLPIDFEGSKTYGKPSGWKDEECSSIQAIEVVDEQGRVNIRTVWQPSKEDMEAIAAGRPICLSLCTPVLCPHFIFTWNENGNPNV